MQDDVKDSLKRLDIPAPSQEAKDRALAAAMQAYELAQEKSSKGFTDTVRPIHKESIITSWIRNHNMKKAYVFAGSFAAVAVVLAITTTHYSTIMQPVIVTPPPAEVTAVQPPVQALKAKDESIVVSQSRPMPPADLVKEEEKATADKNDVPASRIDMNAPGMVGGSGSVVAAAPPPMAQMDAVAKRRHAPLMAQEMVAGNVAPGLPVNSAMPAPGIYPQPTAPQYAGGDRFESRAANLAKVVAQEPVSTFSIDVDTASYSFVRRMLNEGQLPQPEMVRIEEMVNYFPYNYELPQDKSEPFKPSVTVTSTPWNTATKLVHIGIKGYEVTHVKRPAANLVFLVDVSGSMNSPDRLPLVKSSLHMLVDQMDEGDTISIVTYAGYAGTALSPTRGSDKKTIHNVIDMLGAGGSTAGAAGIEQAYQLASQNFNKDGVNRVILATDGDFNVGISDIGQLKSFIEGKRQTGIFLSVLGYGQGNYNDALMQSIAQHGNGNAAYIDNVNEARKVLVDEMSSTLFAIAKDVKIQVEWNPALVSEYRLVGYETRLLNREDFNNDKVDAGEVGAGHAVTAIYEITPRGAKGTNDPLRYSNQAPELDKPASSEFGGEYGFLKIRYKLPDSAESKLMTTSIASGQEVAAIEQASADVRFAVAVAEFGQLLKHDPAVAGGSFDHAITLADGARGSDALRAEFVNLARTAKSLQGGVYYPLPEHDVPMLTPGVMR